jgi:hypothetical protein
VDNAVGQLTIQNIPASRHRPLGPYRFLANRRLNRPPGPLVDTMACGHAEAGYRLGCVGERASASSPQLVRAEGDSGARSSGCSRLPRRMHRPAVG